MYADKIPCDNAKAGKYRNIGRIKKFDNRKHIVSIHLTSLPNLISTYFIHIFEYQPAYIVFVYY